MSLPGNGNHVKQNKLDLEKQACFAALQILDFNVCVCVCVCA